MPNRKKCPLQKLTRQARPTIPIVLIQAEQEVHNIEEGLFETLSYKFRPQHNKAIISFQYCTLTSQNDENAEEWMGRLK